jgi:hypothetical protein
MSLLQSARDALVPLFELFQDKQNKHAFRNCRVGHRCSRSGAVVQLCAAEVALNTEALTPTPHFACNSIS